MARILVVDSDAIVRETLSPTLAKLMAAEVESAGSAQEATALMEREPFDVVLSAFALPDLDGIGFLNKVRERWPDTKRVMVTFQRDPSLRDLAVGTGVAHAFLTKPYNLRGMQRTIRAVLAGEKPPPARGGGRPVAR